MASSEQGCLTLRWRRLGPESPEGSSQFDWAISQEDGPSLTDDKIEALLSQIARRFYEPGTNGSGGLLHVAAMSFGGLISQLEHRDQSEV
jgi:hypothetical protein